MATFVSTGNPSFGIMVGTSGDSVNAPMVDLAEADIRLAAKGQLTVSMVVVDALAVKMARKFWEQLFALSVMIVACCLSLVIAVLDVAGRFNIAHPILWFTVCGGCLGLVIFHIMRLKQLWSIR